MKPWEKYSQSSQAAQAGPWSRYSDKNDSRGAIDSIQKSAENEQRLLEKSSPVADTSFVEDLAAGSGRSAVNLGRRVGQLGLEALTNDNPMIDVISQMVPGVQFLPAARNIAQMPPVKNVLQKTKERLQGNIDEAKQLDKPLMNTWGGNIGDIATTAALTGPLSSLANTYRGATLLGGGVGFMQPVASDESTIEKTALGAVGSAAGKGIFDTMFKGPQALSRLGKSFGQADDYVLPPSQTNPSVLNQTLEGFAGKLTTAQKAAQKNQEVTNKLANRSLGLADDVELTPQVLNDIRDQAGQVYEKIKSIGTLTTDKVYRASLKDIRGTTNALAKEFPELGNTSIDELINAVNKKTISSEGAVEAVKQLRFEGNANIISIDPAKKALGRAQKKVADTIDDLIERNIDPTLGKEILGAYKSARQLIAKTYSVQKALNPSTGNITASKLGREVSKGKPLSGELEKIGKFALRAPAAAKEITTSQPGLSPLDYIGSAIYGGAGSMATGSPHGLLAAGLPFLRAPIRSAILSKPYQAMFGAPLQTQFQSLGPLAVIAGAKLNEQLQ